jgi:2-C-methyl-D-erythritol 4-phosphate cytidylyltransferase
LFGIPPIAGWAVANVQLDEVTVDTDTTVQTLFGNALVTISDWTDLVAVHDSVRPIIDTATIEQVITAAVESGAAIGGIVLVDTVKQVRNKTVKQVRNKVRPLCHASV